MNLLVSGWTVRCFSHRAEIKVFNKCFCLHAPLLESNTASLTCVLTGALPQTPEGEDMIWGNTVYEELYGLNGWCMAEVPVKS